MRWLPTWCVISMVGEGDGFQRLGRGLSQVQNKKLHSDNQKQTKNKERCAHESAWPLPSHAPPLLMLGTINVVMYWRETTTAPSVPLGPT
mmetsp:Transcript_20750/g.33839  ORF Transcript_20750/g.33839 Transcript_20750/m.33839 type:complete len:90 (-) Transcript_20750:1942-2211(-)